MNDLAYVVKQSKLSAYADDTQIFYADKDLAKVQDTINNDLYHVDKWYTDNGMKRNHSKYQAIVMGKTQNKPLFRCENAVIPITEDFDLLGDTVDNKLKFDRHIAKVCRKLSQQIAALKRMKKMLPYEIRKTIYMPFIAPHFNYCAESWHFCNKTSATKLEKVNERAIRFQWGGTPYNDLYGEAPPERGAFLRLQVYKRVGISQV